MAKTNNERKNKICTICENSIPTLMLTMICRTHNYYEEKQKTSFTKKGMYLLF